jgi:hypothetical protein
VRRKRFLERALTDLARIGAAGKLALITVRAQPRGAMRFFRGKNARDPLARGFVNATMIDILRRRTMRDLAGLPAAEQFLHQAAWLLHGFTNRTCVPFRSQENS